ncbi:MAG: glycosyltransferase family 4 protein [Synergistaceae bacterium]|jgi:glycosyltransferase involved in cell wall biosynthesis|nr:glycosyltransferase family 4 protein [Synergistaceae bacterium]
MNIFYDYSAFQAFYSGISRYFHELISRLLDKEDIDVHLFMGLYLNRYGLDRQKNRCKSYWGLNVPAVRYTGFLRNFINRKLWKFFQAKHAPGGGKGCLYHPTYYNFDGYDAFDGLPNARIAVTVHDFTHERYPHLFRKGEETPKVKQKAIERADALICVSESTKNDLLDLYGHQYGPKIRTIYHGYNDLSALSKPGMPLPSAPYFLFVGPRHSYKNFDCLAKAFASSPALKKDFAVVCFGGADFSKKEKERFADLGVAGKMLLYKGGDDVLAVLYKNAAALVFPSFYEGFGFPLLEAMKCGCPVVAGNSSSVPEVAGDAALLFNPESAEDLADQLCRVAYDSEIRDRMIKLGRQHCALFSWDRCLEETLRLYRELLQA